ncbi:MAG: SDR family NAD(P)-dependent oxidoreductase [Acetobacteraceae bacterium]|nr:SDR family NAD(P)-dependent oxidoreductase [Acetobacteraceae bacterium]
MIFGLGYTGTAIAQGAIAAGWRVIATSRSPAGKHPPNGVDLVAFDAAGPAIGEATHVLETAAPDAHGDPALARHGPALAAAPNLRWAGLLSTTGVYGDRGGGWVDEATPPAPTGPRGAKRLEAEQQWAQAFSRCAVDLFRVAGIYGPGRSPFAEIRAGRSRRVDKPGHRFGRIHRDDIALAVLAAMRQARAPGVRVLNLNDDLPVESAEATAEAARLLGLPPPPLVPFEVAQRDMSEMGRSFWAENRQVASRMTQEALGITWRYPTYREGLRAILEQERAEGSPE